MPDFTSLIFNHNLHLSVLQKTATFIDLHPFAATLLFFGLILVLNPISMLGFGPRGRPITGSLAARWHAQGYGATGWYRVLARVGVEGWVLVPAVGGGIVVTVGGWAWAKGHIES